MKIYELTCLLPPTLSEEDMAGVSEKIKNIISEQSGIIQKELRPVKKRFGYQIGQYREGFIITFLVALSPEGLSNLEKRVKEQDNILRYIAVLKTPSQKERRRPSPSSKEGEQKKKVGLKEIDKRINEILKE